MLSPEENDLLTRIGPTTPMGDLIRQYWIPDLMASELPAPDGPPLEEVPIRYRRGVILSILLAMILFATPMLAHGKAKGKGGGVPPGSAEVRGHPAAFLPEERQLIVTYFQGSPGGLPPGLAKRGGQLPPGLQKHLQRNGTLPPGLQKRLQPLPTTLEIQLPSLPDIWGRVILGPHVLLIDRRTNQILDVLENVLTVQ